MTPLPHKGASAMLCVATRHGGWLQLPLGCVGGSALGWLREKLLGSQQFGGPMLTHTPPTNMAPEGGALEEEVNLAGAMLVGGRVPSWCP